MTHYDKWREPFPAPKGSNAGNHGKHALAERIEALPGCGIC
ncbi:hypothetical protein ABFV83_20265 [Lacrimispora sp. BS-2]|uniref:Uncharacterized protein n=1 Tax=Lacrimispora sp. BS-2 TaxID=3151850 RepID=A0AAU7PP13_9FIRM